MWTCKCGNVRKVLEGKGWTNLEQNVLQYLKKMEEELGDTRQLRIPAENYFVDNKTSNLFGWLQWS